MGAEAIVLCTFYGEICSANSLCLYSTDPFMNSGLMEMFQEKGIVIAPGAYDAISAIMIEKAGFRSIYVGGASTSYSTLGKPDLGFVGLEGMTRQISRIHDVSQLPLICDADTGYGNELNVAFTVRAYEAAGASAIQIEDQVTPKRCGHLSGKEVIPPEEMEIKVKAAVRARRNALIIARTDALAINGIGDAIERANRYLEAGADLAFVESPRTREELHQIGREVKGLKMANMVEGGKTPLTPARDLMEMGFSLVIYPGAPIRAALMGIQRMLGTLLREGSTAGYLENMVDFGSLQKILGTEEILKGGFLPEAPFS